MTANTADAGRPASTLRRVQEIDDGANDNDNVGAGSGSLTTMDMSFLSNVTIDDSGVGHVKVNNSMDWSEILSNDSTVRIIYEGSGSSEQVLIIPVKDNASRSTGSSSSSSSGSMSGNSSVVDNLPTGSSNENSYVDSVGVIGTGSSSTILVIVGSVLAIVAIAAITAVVLYGRRNRRRAFSEDPDEPFIVGSLPHQPAPQLSMLDADITPDLWVEGQYRYSPNMSGLENSLSGTAILSDNNTTSLDHRLTVDAYPFGPNTKRGRRHIAPLDHSQRRRRDNGPLDDISDRGRYRRGTTPVVLYEEDSVDEYETNSSRKNQSHRRTSQRQRPSTQQHRHHRHRESLEQQRTSRRDKYATRRDR
ncbi:hypothetical protein GN244_ATG05548 [Phytophthora infestans]|uniref:Transmembrane protein n=1 Tax=Phytophthora infestans TaxID=4787 RepID=A0A833SJX3_PHYIN|nr:hypothetical protein GN244_ATG05548 [Phytophthora infestans]KAF4137919.1 hypothetical protein GN958_ATG12872 [Phytophthora infestans]